MTDNEIIKALECCPKAEMTVDCKALGCPVYQKKGCGYVLNCDLNSTTDAIIEGLSKDALDLINRQKAEIERLKKHLGEAHYKLEYLLCEATGGLLSKHTYNADTMITYAHNYVLKCSDEAQAEAVKEFAERLCEGKLSNDPVVIAVKCELKEMAGDTDAEN